MSETNVNTNPVEALAESVQNGQAQMGQTKSDIEAELNRLGENVGKLFKNVWDTEELKSIEREIRKGLDDFNKQINKAVEQARSQTRTDESVRKAKDSVKSAWETAHGPQVLKEMRLGLVDSLKRLNEELTRLAEVKPAQEIKVEVPSVEMPSVEVPSEVHLGDVTISTEMGNPLTDPLPVKKPKTK